MENEEPMRAGNPGLKVDQAKNQILDINHIGPEKNLKQNAAYRDDEKKKKGKIVSQNRNIENLILQ